MEAPGVVVEIVTTMEFVNTPPLGEISGAAVRPLARPKADT